MTLFYVDALLAILVEQLTQMGFKISLEVTRVNYAELTVQTTNYAFKHRVLQITLVRLTGFKLVAFNETLYFRNKCLAMWKMHYPGYFIDLQQAFLIRKLRSF